MTRTNVFVMTSLALLIGACGKDKGGGGGSKGTGTTIDPAAVNSLVPEELKGKLEFEKRDVELARGRDKTVYTFAAPKGWVHESKMFANLEPPKDAGIGFFTRMKVNSNCDGECKPKEWEKIADKTHFEPLAAGKVLKDVKGKGNRLMVAETSSNGVELTQVVFAWWTDGASSYYYCHAELDKEAKAAASAFEKACQAVTITGDD